MDVSLLMSLILGLPVAILATLKIIDWYKKRRAGNLTGHNKEKSGREAIIKEGEQSSPATPADQELAPIISQAEMAAEVERQIAEELRHYEAKQRRREPREEGLHRIR